jgi:tRNA acetyltransferase TAN1
LYLVIDLLQDFNLLISTSRRNEKNACSEIWYLLGEIGDKNSEATTTGIIGLTVAKTALDPKEVVRRLREILREKPWEIKYVLKIVPVETLVSATIEDITKASMELSKRIGEDEKFRVTVEKRRSNLSTREIIEAVAKNVNRKVDLENPDRTILVEVVGQTAGLSLLESDDILSIEKERRTL